MTPLTLLYRDESIAAFNKPSGLLLHRSFIDRSETRFALQLARNQLGRHVYPVHRLDRPTSGVLLFALNPQDAAKLTELFASGAVKKRYLAITRGIMPPAGLIDYPLVEEQDRCDPYAQRDKGAQRAVTGFTRLATTELPFAIGRYPTSRYSLVEAIPHTGRRHQIRRHFKHIFHPLIGDVNHGEGRHNRFFREEFHCSRLLLHAAELSFVHPAGGLPMTITAPLDETLVTLLQRLEWQGAVPSAWLQI